jgi:hypothetical protein
MITRIACQKRVAFVVAMVALSAIALLGAVGRVAQDSYTSTAAPVTNFGTGPSIDVGFGATSQGFIQFDLSTLPAGTTSSEVTKAVAYIFVNKVATTGYIQFAPLNAAWTESGITHGNQPTWGVPFPAAPGILLTSGPTGTTQQFMAVDVTTQVQYWLSHPGTNYGNNYLDNSDRPDYSCSGVTGRNPRRQETGFFARLLFARDLSILARSF